MLQKRIEMFREIVSCIPWRKWHWANTQGNECSRLCSVVWHQPKTFATYAISALC